MTDSNKAVQTKIGSDASVSGVNIGGQVSQNDVDDAEILGRGFWSTTGEMVVDKNWLEGQFDEYGVSRKYLPDVPTPRRVYRRAISYLIFPGVFKETWHAGHKYEAEVRSGEGTVEYVELNEYDPSEGEGEWVRHELGSIKHEDLHGEPTFHMNSDLQKGYPRTVWANTVKRMKVLFDDLTDSYVDTDLRSIIGEVKNDALAIKLRSAGVVSFLPEADADVLEGLTQVWSAMNHADRADARKIGSGHGYSCEIITLPVFENRATVVEQRVDERLEDEVNSALDRAFERLESDADDTSTEIVDDIITELGGVDELAATYSDILDAQLSTKRRLRDRMRNMNDEDRKEIVSAALNRTN